MAEIDNPLKMLITEFSPAFAAWLLGRPIQSVQPLNVEFPANPLQSDLLFEVIDQQSRKLLLHIELQGRRSHKPMPFRQLEYMTQTVVRELGLPLGLASPRLHSVVMYVGNGSGREDTGRYIVYGLTDTASLSWQYQVIRLWEMSAADLLAIGQVEPALLALLGQTKLEEPERIMPQALARLRQIENPVEKGRILTALVSLLRGEEVITMVEKLLDTSDELLLDTPYLQRIRRLGREEGREEGVQIGRQEGVQIGRQEGVQIGRQEGVQIGRQEGLIVGQEIGLRQAILSGVLRKFDLLATDYKQLEQYLDQIRRPAALQQILLTLLEAQDVGVIVTLAAEMAGGEKMDEA